MSFPTYEYFKDSGFQWLGKVPESWEVNVSRRYFYEIREPGKFEDVQLSASQKFGVVPQTMFMELEDQKVVLALKGLSNFKHVEPDDFVISLRSFQGGIERSKFQGCVSPAYTVLRPKKIIDPTFFSYVFKSAGYIVALQSVTDGIREGKNIKYDQFAELGLALPPITEQKIIAKFLNHETEKIDSLVAEQEKLIELLKEKRQGIILNSVTKGLNANVSYKDSGVQWIGKVPEHWKIDRLKISVSSCKNGIWGDDPQGDNNDIPCVRVADFDRRKLRVVLDEPTIRNVTEKERLTRILHRGDLLLEKSGGGEHQPVGTVVLYEEDQPAVCSNFVAKVVVNNNINPSYMRYVHFAIYSLRITTKSINQTSGIQNLDQDKYFNEKAPFPPKSEQDLISGFLDEETSRFDNLTSEAELVIDLLKERRSALISAAVTGQIDVRNYQPEETA